MAKVIAQNVTLGYRLGGPQDGATGFSGSPTAIQCLARSIQRDATFGTVDLGGLCATESALQVTRKTGTMTVELFVETANPVFQSSNGYYIETTFTPYSGATAIVDTGVITGVGLGVDIDGALIEKITIALGVH